MGREAVLRHPAVDAPIVGPTKPHHLADAAAAVELGLTDAEVAALEEHYTPRLLSGHSGYWTDDGGWTDDG